MIFYWEGYVLGEGLILDKGMFLFTGHSKQSHSLHKIGDQK